MIELRETADGVILPVHARPKARRNHVTGEHDGRLKIAITEAPEKGRANAALTRLLADALQVNRSQVALVSGVNSRQKEFLISDVGIDKLRQQVRVLSGNR